MVAFVAMLRGVNVGGKRPIKMGELKELLFSQLGLSSVRTYVQSGNVVFLNPGRDASNLAREVERAVNSRFGTDIAVLLRSSIEMCSIVNRCPFLDGDTSSVHVTFLDEKPKEFPVSELEAARGQGEEFSALDREVYLFLPNGYGRTKLSNTFFERRLKTRATTRNWKTVRSLCEMSSELE